MHNFKECWVAIKCSTSRKLENHISQLINATGTFLWIAHLHMRLYKRFKTFRLKKLTGSNHTLSHNNFSVIILFQNVSNRFSVSVKEINSKL